MPTQAPSYGPFTPQALQPNQQALQSLWRSIANPQDHFVLEQYVHNYYQWAESSRGLAYRPEADEARHIIKYYLDRGIKFYNDRGVKLRGDALETTTDQMLLTLQNEVGEAAGCSQEITGLPHEYSNVRDQLYGRGIYSRQGAPQNQSIRDQLQRRLDEIPGEIDTLRGKRRWINDTLLDRTATDLISKMGGTPAPTPPPFKIIDQGSLSEGERARLNAFGEALGARDQLQALRRAGNYDLAELDASQLGAAHSATERAVLFELSDLSRAHPDPATLAQIQTELAASIENGRTFSNDWLGRPGIRLTPDSPSPELRARGLMTDAGNAELLGEERLGLRTAVLADAETLATTASRVRSGNAVANLALLVGVPLLASIGAAQASPTDIMGSLQKAVTDRKLSQTEADSLARDMMMLQVIGVRPDPIAHDTVARLRKEMNGILDKHPGISQEFSDGFNRLITTLSGEQHAENIAPQHFAATTPKSNNQLG